MAMTKELTIQLPEKLAELVNAKVSSGEFSNESDFIAASLVEWLLESTAGEDRTEGMNKEGVRRLAALKADPASGLTHEQFWGQLEAEGIVDEAE